MGMQRSFGVVQRFFSGFGFHFNGFVHTFDFEGVVEAVAILDVNDAAIDLGGTRFLNLSGDRMRVLSQLPINRPPVIYHT